MGLHIRMKVAVSPLSQFGGVYATCHSFTKVLAVLGFRPFDFRWQETTLAHVDEIRRRERGES